MTSSFQRLRLPIGKGPEVRKTFRAARPHGWSTLAADSGLRRDGPVHPLNPLVFQALAIIRRSGARWLITTTFVEWMKNEGFPTRV